MQNAYAIQPLKRPKMKRLVILVTLFILFPLLSVKCSAQDVVAGADPLYHGFLDPPHDFSPMPFWFWNGKMEGPIIQQQIRDMVDQHVYGAFLHGRDGLETPYFSEGWFRPSAPAWNSRESRASSSISLMSMTGLAAKCETYGWPAIIRARCWRSVLICA